jgi:hypothetical protein
VRSISPLREGADTGLPVLLLDSKKRRRILERAGVSPFSLAAMGRYSFAAHLISWTRHLLGSMLGNLKDMVLSSS